jgi:hypothetical protein
MLLLAFFAAIAHVAAATTAAAPFLKAVAVVENAREGQRGAAGEEGRTQFLPSTRADRLRELRARGILNPTEAQIERAHFEWLCTTLRAYGVEPLPFNLALAWNSGAKATATGRAPEASYDYARRVVAVMEATP